MLAVRDNSSTPRKSGWGKAVCIAAYLTASILSDSQHSVLIRMDKGQVVRLSTPNNLQQYVCLVANLCFAAVNQQLLACMLSAYSICENGRAQQFSIFSFYIFVFQSCGSDKRATTDLTAMQRGFSEPQRFLKITSQPQNSSQSHSSRTVREAAVQNILRF